ncbi:MAG: DUF3093 domain-containing protein [Mycobacteriaceae bacterium]
MPAKKINSTWYSEQLRVPLWWWAAGLFIAGLLAAEVSLGRPGILFWLPYLALLPVPIWALIWLSRTRVEVKNNPDTGEPELCINQAHLPTRLIARWAEVPASAKSAALGRQLDPAAFVQHRTWVKTMVLVVLEDPEDPTPYWLVSTRRPAELLAVIEKSQRH